MNNTMPRLVKKALRQVQKKFPKVVYVCYSVTGVYSYYDRHLCRYWVDDETNLNLIHRAAKMVPILPAIYYLPKKGNKK